MSEAAAHLRPVIYETPCAFGDLMLVRLDADLFQLARGRPGRLQAMTPAFALEKALARARLVVGGQRPDDPQMACLVFAAALIALAPAGDAPRRLVDASNIEPPR